VRERGPSPIFVVIDPSSLSDCFTMLDESRSMRQLRLLRILGSRRYGATLREMTCEIGVTEKTISRDLAEFSRHGFPLEKTAGDRGRITWKLTAGWGQPPLAIVYSHLPGTAEKSTSSFVWPLDMANFFW
jgi:hypothetical protein